MYLVFIFLVFMMFSPLQSSFKPEILCKFYHRLYTYSSLAPFSFIPAPRRCLASFSIEYQIYLESQLFLLVLRDDFAAANVF